MSALATVRAALQLDERTLAQTLTHAFFEGTLAEWLVPDAGQRWDVYTRYWSMIARHALRSGALVDTTGPRQSVALWYPAGPDRAPDVAPGDYEAQLPGIAGEAAGRFRALDAAVHDAYPPLEDPWAYLGFVAVEPSAQNRGLGRLLLQTRHADLDRDGVPAFLVASTERSARLYARLGYQPTGPAIRPAGNAPQLYPMIRFPAGPAGH